MLLALLGLGAALPAAATIYRCEDDRGTVNFTDTRVPQARCRVVSADVGETAPRVTRRQRGEVGEITIGPSRPGPGAPGSGPRQPVPTPGFIDAQKNLLEFRRREALAPFATRWRTGSARINILHLGDSHVHNGFAGAATRRALQAVRGDGGRGLVFPYALAKTYSQSDYRSSFEGSWQSANSVRPLPGLALGVTGVAARTTRAPAAFTLTFAPPLPPGRKVVKVFLKGSMPGLRLSASTGRQRQVLAAGWGAARALPVAEFELYDLERTLRLDIDSTAPGGSVEVHGVSIESSRPGVAYHSLGVDGATLDSLNAQPFLAEQLAVLQPDMIVLDFGTNELINNGNALPPGHEALVVQVIRRLRMARPDAVIVLTSAQDMNFQGRAITAARAYSDLMRKIALEQGCLFWDWYRVAGGSGSMRSWVARGLANRDQIHLVAKGYQLKGELLAKALLDTVAQYEQPRR
ncbi:MAG: GDSL-type esterase/lipase family protein [Pseudomonadota bacterium]